ncbi:hypothetical protein BDV93DRAFT_526517 [Ceratobasidium sp. AG-I]|nr:hypothetical protein BDV93DRAFT_526517 [Ceratobasidium sp. AG-I]
MDRFGANHLLTQIAATCPNLTKLNILPENLQHPADLILLGPNSQTHPFTAISQLHNLRVLHSSSAVLNSNVLQLLGNLPCLESLAACSRYGYDEEYSGTSIADLTLPEHSFPALRHLGVSRVPGTVVSKLWQTPPLVRNLVSVQVQFVYDYDTEAPSDLIRVICQGSPEVTDLDLCPVEFEGIDLSSVVAEHFRRLPLLRLRIWDFIIDYRPLILALPDLEYLSIHSVYVDFKGLSFIAKHMPRLQYLGTDLLLKDWPEESELPHKSSSPSPCQIESQFLFEVDFGSDTNRQDFNKELDSIARGLWALWPRGVRCGLGYDYDELRSGDDPASLERVNERIKTLSGISALDVPTAEESASRWLYGSQ